MEKSNKKPLLIVSSTLVAILIVGVTVFLLLRYCSPKKDTDPSDPGSGKITYLFNYEPTLINEGTSLQEDKSLVLENTLSNKFKATLTISCGESNAAIGPYLTHDFMYRSYGKETNTLKLSISFIDVFTNQAISDYENLEYVVYLGNSESHTALTNDKYVVENSVLTYTASETIYLYKVAVGVSI